MSESKKRKRKPSKQTKVMETGNDALYESCAGLKANRGDCPHGHGAAAVYRRLGNAN